MAKSTLFGCALVASLLPACTSSPDPAPTVPTRSSKNAVSDPLVYRSRVFVLRLRQALARFEESPPALAQYQVKPCPDAEIRARASNPEGKRLLLTHADSRFEAHSLIPLQLADLLQSNENALFDPFFEAPRAGAQADPLFSKLLKSEQHAESAERQLERLEARFYRGVFHITEFKKAHLIRRKGKWRREWTKGVLRAWFVVYDIDTNESLCQTPMLAINDVEDAPISIRMRPDTQNRFVRQLGEQFQAEAARALGSISHELTLPTSSAPEGLAASPNSAGHDRRPLLTLAQPAGKQKSLRGLRSGSFPQ